MVILFLIFSLPKPFENGPVLIYNQTNQAQIFIEM